MQNSISSQGQRTICSWLQLPSVLLWQTSFSDGHLFVHSPHVELAQRTEMSFDPAVPHFHVHDMDLQHLSEWSSFNSKTCFKEHFPSTFYFPSLILSIPRISPFPLGRIQGPLFVICFLDPSLTFDIFSVLSAWPLSSLGCRCPQFFSYCFFVLPEHYIHLHHVLSFRVCCSFGTKGGHKF